MTAPKGYADAALTIAGWAAILAPLVGLALKFVSAGWLLVVMVWTFPVWILGYALVVVAAAHGMLRRKGALRAPDAVRRRAVIWALAASIGVVLVGLTIIDGGDTAESIGSALTRMFGADGDSALADTSSAIVAPAVAAWLIGSIALVVEWIAALVRRRRQSKRVAPPVAPPVLPPAR